MDGAFSRRASTTSLREVQKDVEGGFPRIASHPATAGSRATRLGEVLRQRWYLVVLGFVAAFLLLMDTLESKLIGPPNTARLTNTQLALNQRFVDPPVVDDQRDRLLPNKWVREYRLCERDIATRQWDDDYKSGLLYRGGEDRKSPDHNAYLDPGACATVADVPSAHRVGRGGYPEIRLTLWKDDLRTIFGVDGLDEGHTGDTLSVLSPEHMEEVINRLGDALDIVIQVRAARFDPRRGEFIFTVWVERLRYDFREADHGAFQFGTFSILNFADRFKVRIINYLFNRARRAAQLQAIELGLNEQEQQAAMAVASPFKCAFGTIVGKSRGRTAARRMYVKDGQEAFAAFRFACAYPLHPTPPPATPFAFQLELRGDEEWRPTEEWSMAQMSEQKVIGLASLRICSSIERRVSFAYCSAAVYNDRNLPYLRSYIRHHTYLGVQVFHLYVRYDPAPMRDLLADEIRVGLVQLHPAPESIYWYFNGHPRPYAPYLDQHLHQLECMSNHHESAQYILSADLDEYLYFPQAEKEHSAGEEQESEKETDSESDASSADHIADGDEDALPPRPPETPDNWHLDQYAATCLARTASGSIYFTGEVNKSATPPPPVFFLEKAAVALEPGPVSPAVYAALTHLPLGCRSMMADMMVHHARPWAQTSPNEVPPGRLPSLGWVPHPYPYPKTSLPMNAPLALPHSFRIRDWPHRIESDVCRAKRESVAAARAASASKGFFGTTTSCSLPMTDWTPSHLLPSPVCPLMMRFPWPVAYTDVDNVPPKSLFRTRAAIDIEIHSVVSGPPADTDPHPHYDVLLSAEGVRLLHFVYVHRTVSRHMTLLNATEHAAEAAFAHRDLNESPFVAFHRRMMSDADRLPLRNEPRYAYAGALAPA